MTPTSSPSLGQVPLSCQHTPPPLSLTPSAATICYPLAYLACCNTHTRYNTQSCSLFNNCTSRASSERQSGGHLHSDNQSSHCRTPRKHPTARFWKQKSATTLKRHEFNIMLFAFACFLSTSFFPTCYLLVFPESSLPSSMHLLTLPSSSSSSPPHISSFTSSLEVCL